MEHERKSNFRSESVFSKKIKAGKRRTYFFDVKSTRSNDYFLTITESKKRMDDSYDRFKIFIYKEDLNKFLETLTDTIDHIKTQLMPNFDFDAFNRPQEYHSDQPSNYAPRENKSTIVSEPEAPLNEETTNTNESSNTSDQTPPPPGNEDDLKW